MIDRILEFSLRQRLFVLLATGLLLGIGLYSARELPIDAVPDITSPQVQVNTEVAVLAPEEAENLVTRIIELELAGLPGVTELRSLTKYGLSQVTLQFEDGTDIYRARQLVTERVQNVRDRLPPGTEPRLAPITTGLGEIFYYTLSWESDAPNKPADEQEALMQLYETQEYVAKPFLRATPGVAEVNAVGGLQRQFVVEPDPQKLRDVNLTFEELAHLIAHNTSNGGGGVINQEGRKLIVRVVSRAQTVEDLENLPIKFAGGVTPLLVKDLAKVRIGSKPRSGAATKDGQETCVGSVMMLAGENSRVIAHRVDQRLEALRERLPSGIELTVQYDRSELVDRTIETVKHNLFEGAIFVIVILLLLLGNWRAALIVAFAIPLSFLCAVIGMTHFGISGNLMSLGAVDFGLIIDGAVVIVENIVRQFAHRQQHLGRPLNAGERIHTVLSASKQVASPMFFGVIIITLVYAPILALTGIEGKMFRPMALTVMLALGGALVLSVTLMPALCSLLLRGKVSESENFLIRWIKALYEPILRLALKLRYAVFAGALALFAFSLFVFTRLGTEFAPQLDEGSTTMMVYRPVGQALEVSLDVQKKIDRFVLKTFPEVDRVFSRIGTAEVATDPMPPNEADFYIFYKPRDQWKPRNGTIPTKTELATMIGRAIQEQEAFDCEVMVAQPIEMRFNEMLEGIRADLAVKVFGPDFDVMEPLAEKIKSKLEQIPGVEEVGFETEGRTPILTLTVKRDQLLRRGLGSDAVNDAIATAMAGQDVGTLQIGLRVFDVLVRMSGDLREQINQIKALPVRVGETGMVPLGDLVDFTTIEAVEPIRRDDAKRRAALMINLDTNDVEGWVKTAQAAVKEIDIPEGYTVEFGGQFEHLEEARARLAIVVPAALLLIFVLIFMAFGSLREAVVVYTGIPLAITGGVFALWLRDMPFSITAAVGFIALSGVAVLNGVVLVSYFNQLREETLDDVQEAVVEGSLTRLRPVLMTATVAALGFVPMALSTGAGAEVQRPLATVVIGGILSSTFLTLVVLPALYWTVERRCLLTPRKNAVDCGSDGDPLHAADSTLGA